jgi:ABC-2 type transport system permease protein
VRAFFTILRKELFSLWVAPLAWVLLVVFLLIQGAVFYSIVLDAASSPDAGSLDGPLSAFFGQSSLVLLSLMLICPPLTMRAFAEERRAGTIEVLLTAPVSPSAVVMGKFTAALLTYCLIWLPTLAYVFLLQATGTVDWGVIASSYLGVLSVGATYLAIGVLMSAMTRSQLVALLMTLAVVFGLFLLGVIQYLLPAGTTLDFASQLAAQVQLEEMSRGVVDSRRLVSSATLIALPLYYAIRVVDAWRWQ